METDFIKESSKKNITIIAWVLIAIHILGLYQVMSGFGPQINVTGGMPGRVYPMQFYVLTLNIISILGLLMDAAFIYYAVCMLNFFEKGRSRISLLIICNIILNIAAFIFSLVTTFSFDYPMGMTSYLTSALFFGIVRVVIFNGTVITAYYLIYRYLNKPETKSVFEPKPVHQQEV